MKSKSRACRITVLLAALAVVAAAAPVMAGGDPGDAGFLSLRMPVGARETGMGGAGVGAASGAAAVYWNPARLAFDEQGTDLLLQHQRLYDLFDKETAIVAHRTSHGALGFFFSGFYSDDIDRYGTEPVGVPEGTFNPHQVALGVSYSRMLGADIAGGLTVKYLHEEIDIYGGSAVAFDFSVSHKALVDGLFLGAALQNLGSGITLNEVEYDLPMTVRLGAGYDPQHPFFAGNFSFAADVLIPNDGNEKAHIGAEYRIMDILALRLGTKINYESQGLTAGAGFAKGRIEVGYAYEDMDNELDPSHRFVIELHY